MGFSPENIDNFLQTLPMMGMGLGGILAVTLILIGVMVLLTKIFKEKK